MGYFSNGSEGEHYQAGWCDQCAHDDYAAGKFCPVWSAHLGHNYGASDEVRGILDSFIPQIGAFNGGCRMFVAESPALQGMEDEKRKAWDARCKIASMPAPPAREENDD